MFWTAVFSVKSGGSRGTAGFDPPEDARGELADLYQSILQNFGSVPEGLQLFGVSPGLLRYILSLEGGCGFCTGCNAMLLLNAGITEDALEKVRQDPLQGPMEARENALHGPCAPGCPGPALRGTGRGDGLRRLGWADQDIFDAVAHRAQHTAVDILFETFRVAPYPG